VKADTSSTSARHSFPAVSRSFYAAAPTLRHFADLAREDVYADIPGDHCVVVTDVVGSTEAVRAGRYREVNYVGAASIAAVLNATDHADVPFVFGGDGATLVVPKSLLPTTEAALAALRQHASESFGFELRVGVVPVHEIRAAGHRLAVARYEVSPNYVQAMFVGSGMTYAERLVKNPETCERYGISADAFHADDPYAGLECRWEDIRSASGETITLLVDAEGPTEAERLAIYRDVIRTIETTFGHDSAAHPIAPDRLWLSRDPRRFAPEVWLRHHAAQRWRQTVRLWVLNLIGVVLIRLGLETSETDWSRYPTLLWESTDYRKFDDMLRMVLSGTPSQRRRLEAYLEQRHRDGALVYGLHVSDRAVLTCLVHERMGRQVHFVDGADGGYTMAAAALKRRAHSPLQPA